MRPEEKLHFQIAEYIRVVYPKIFFISESSGIRVTVGLAAKLKRTRSAHTHLDLYILEPRNGYCGLLLELKAKNIYKKSGELLKNDHVAEQAKTVDALNKKGYKASFALSFNEAQKLIDEYLK